MNLQDRDCVRVKTAAWNRPPSRVGLRTRLWLYIFSTIVCHHDDARLLAIRQQHRCYRDQSGVAQITGCGERTKPLALRRR